MSIEIIAVENGYVLGHSYFKDGKRVIDSILEKWTQEDYDKYIEESMKIHKELWS